AAVHAFDAGNGGEGTGVQPRFGLRSRAIPEMLDGCFAGIAGPVVHATRAFDAALGAYGDDGNGAADCVREPGEPLAHASHGQAERDCRAAGHRREPRADHLATPYSNV